MKPVCIIPARGGSKGIPRKNIRKIGGKPLIAYTIMKAKKSKIFSHIVVSTEDKEIALTAKRYGAEVPFLRPKNISHEKSPDIEWVTWIMKILNRRKLLKTIQFQFRFKN